MRPHYARYAHAAPHVRAAHYARRASPHYATVTDGVVPSSPAFSALVVDANSGRTLYSADENGLRHPASITKVMTLYLLFEKLDSGAMTLQTPISISQHAAAQEPSKLGLLPGDSISVDDAIKAVVTRSANDIAVAIAEAVGQSESNFADLMTRKARALGMSNTLYRNASGLPNDEQVTTAHDLTILGRSLEERFPRYFRYFSTAHFDFDGEVIGNHNHLLGRVDGVDGIKTGYTRASGFNLLTSVHRDGRSLIAVVMGGRSAAGRDRIMENLIGDHIAEASTTHTATAVADASPVETAEPREEQPEATPMRARATVVAQAKLQRISATARAANAAGEGDDGAGDEEASGPRPDAQAAGGSRRCWLDQSPHQGVKENSGPAGGGERAGHAAARTACRRQKSRGAGTRRGQRSPRRKRRLDDPDRRAPRISPRPTPSWPAPSERNRSTLASAKPITEKVRKGDATLYRARFAGLDSASAEAACRSLKRTGFSCFPAHDD